MGRIKVLDYTKESLKLHYELKGKLEIVPKVAVDTREALSLAYTPGVSAPCLEIARDVSKSYELTGRGNLVAVITDGTAVLGLGDIGPEAGMPVMEGKCVLFKAFGNIDAIPLCINSKDVDDIVSAVSMISPSFGGINLEDISAPRCFEIEERLKKLCGIPIFHDDRHGTAIVVLAALYNSVILTKRNISDAKIVINGAGAAGTGIVDMLILAGAKDVVLCDRAGAIYAGRSGIEGAKAELASKTNPRMVKGGLADAVAGADVFIGVSAPRVLTAEMVKSMANEPVVFALSNPEPEIMPDEAKSAGAAVVGTGRSDFNNQINNVLAFPGVFRGALDVRAREINDEMKLAAANALAQLAREGLNSDRILPESFDKRIVPAVAQAVADAARETGVAGI